MNVQHYKNIILPLLREAFEEREADNLFKYTLEDYFKKRYFDVKSYDLNDDEMEELNFIYEKISNHYPIQYIFNKADFYGLEFYVNEQVLIPRPETEELVHWILNENESTVNEITAPVSFLDIGTGSGCIPVTVKKHRPTWQMSTLDISEQALAIAKKNAADHKVEIEFIQSDILNIQYSTPNTPYNIIASNPPYIPLREKERMSVSTIEYEPHIALFVDNETPILFYEKIADFAQKHLAAYGKLYFELNEFNANEVKEMLQQKGFQEITLKQDLAGKDRMIRAQK